MSENLRNLSLNKPELFPVQVKDAARSFYQHTDSKKKVFICNGSACLTARTQAHVRQTLEKEFKSDEIGEMSCLGLCHKNSSFMYEKKSYSLKNNSDFKKCIQNSSFEKTNVHIDTEYLTEKINSIHDLYNIADQFENKTDETIKELLKSELRGRGGAGFPFALKVKGCLSQPSTEKYVVCNADEGDPGAFSDKYLLDEHPHKVLFGMFTTARLIGAKKGYLYIRAEYPETHEFVKLAIEEFEKTKQFQSYPFEFIITPGHGSYICGEETSLLNSIEGVRAEVRVRPPYPTEYGLFGKPTVLSNVETFANISNILKKGGDTFSSLGTKQSKGTKLVCLDGYFNTPGIHEVEMGIPLTKLFDDLGQGFNTPIKAVQIGGPLGGIVPKYLFCELLVSFESFQEKGFLLGHASVVSIPEDFSMVTYLEHIFEFAEMESCGKCFPCRLGSKQGLTLLQRAIHHGEKIDQELFDDLLETMEIGSLCGFGSGIPLPVKNILTYFKHELTSIFKG